MWRGSAYMYNIPGLAIIEREKVLVVLYKKKRLSLSPVVHMWWCTDSYFSSLSHSTPLPSDILLHFFGFGEEGLPVDFPRIYDTDALKRTAPRVSQPHGQCNTHTDRDIDWVTARPYSHPPANAQTPIQLPPKKTLWAGQRDKSPNTNTQKTKESRLYERLCLTWKTHTEKE
jgi:hypothetical protein